MLTDVRKSVSFTGREAEVVERVFAASSDERACLETLRPGERLDSESAVLRALVLLGVEHLRERILEHGYEALAEASTPDDDAEREAIYEAAASVVATDVADEERAGKGR